jgi:N-methylhydantoinase B
MTPIQLNIFASRVESICDEMGEILKRTALSSNIKDRLDYSCALFDAKGRLFAQAAHIPVHLGSMAFAMEKIVSNVEWAPGDMVMLNDPFLGGTHLPDITFIAPLFSGHGPKQQLKAFVVNRAHHANIGATSPGSMPLSATLEAEGIVIPPTHIVKNDRLDEARLLEMFREEESLEPGARLHILGDFTAQVSANRAGYSGLAALITNMGVIGFETGVGALNDYGRRLAEHTLSSIPDGIYSFTDYMDDDGYGQENIPIQCELRVKASSVTLDFNGTAKQVAGNINCPMSVAAAAVYYVFRCLMPPQTPACYGTFSAITLQVPEGCLLNANRPAAVASGNVETSTRVVDVVLGALAQVLPERIPAASQGSMNNIAMGARGSQPWDYYETLAGGTGASSSGAGLSAVHSHMTNTLNTPVESLEMHYPLMVERYAIRADSGGKGQFKGGDGLIRDYRFLQDTEVTLLTERRRSRPWGLAGGQSGLAGLNTLNGQTLAGKCQLSATTGDILSIQTPGGGGWGEPTES